MTEVARLTSEGALPKLKRVIGKELRELLPPTIFFFVAFHILVFFRALMLRQYGVQLSSVAGATVAALVVGKVVLIADALPFVNPLRELVRAIGPREVPRMFFGGPSGSTP
jgi:hypothetical protein